jgi:nitrite reductase (NADH) large subunit
VLVGACLYGDTADGGWYFRQIREGHNVSEIRDHLMFGEGTIGDVGHQGADKTANMPDSMEVCGCNGVCKGTIVKAIQENGLFSVDEVKKHTKAASSCGSCTGLVEQILISTVGGAADVKPKSEKAICGCSDLNHGQIRQAIREQHLTSMAQTMAFLNWSTPNGCATCRPARWKSGSSSAPGEAQDDPQSRLINERAHANIQKDGTYSVVPRMWGGVTNSSELRRIADVADKYNVTMVKVTGGQRIDLLGIKKEDLPAVWKELDMPSGHAYGKSIRTVKTCVGSEFCRFGTQNSTQLGIDLEHDLFNMWSPHKVKLAVSGCPRNCAEAGIKDVGIIVVDSGFELYIGGNGGIKTEVAEFFVKVKTAEEVREYNAAFLQLYREEAFYLERTVHYLQRVGMEHIKKVVLEDEANRKALAARLHYALSFEQDPWKQRIETPQLKKEFDTIKVVQLEEATV